MHIAISYPQTANGHSGAPSSSGRGLIGHHTPNQHPSNSYRALIADDHVPHMLVKIGVKVTAGFTRSVVVYTRISDGGY